MSIKDEICISKGTKMGDIIFRRAIRSDAEGIFRVLSSAFKLEKDSYKWNNMRSIAYGGAENFLLMEKNSEIIGTVMISPHWLRVGSAKILKGDIGEVAILRELHGQGYGTRLMQECVSYLAQNGYHVSRLGGLTRFYFRFGYVPFPRRYYEFLLTNVNAGASVFTPEDYLVLTSEQEKCVRYYHPSRDWKRRDEIYDKFNENRSGSYFEYRNYASPPTGEPDPSALRFVYDDGNEIKGYIFAVEYPCEITPFEAKVTIYDTAFDLDCPQSFTVLIKYMLSESLKRNAQRVTARLPFDPLVQKLLIDTSISYSLQELQSGIASNMMSVTNLKGTLEAIAHELTHRRLDAIKCDDFIFKMIVDSHEATIKVGESSVEVMDKGESNLYLNCDTTAFLRWLFGLNGFDEWQLNVSSNLNRSQKSVLSSLFSRQPCASGPWG
ncbi:MAG: GNAT family N-acetyltransferase [bacterium]